MYNMYYLYKCIHPCMHAYNMHMTSVQDDKIEILLCFSL